MTAAKKRGRPPNPVPPVQRAFTADGDADRLKALSALIAARLGRAEDRVTDALAEAAVQHEVMDELQRKAPLATPRRGRRPTIDTAVLLRDCALIYRDETGADPLAELAKIGGWEEDGDAPPSTVKAYALAVLGAVGVTPGSLRQQARRALEWLPPA